MKEKFIITIESFHYADRGTQNNVSGRNEVFRIKAVNNGYHLMLRDFYFVCVNWVFMSFFMLEIIMGLNY